MSTQPKALRLADALDELDRQFSRNGLCGDAAAELRRLALKQWVGLTDQELEEMHNEIKVRLMGTYRTEDIYRSIEAKLKEKNT